MSEAVETGPDQAPEDQSVQRIYPPTDGAHAAALAEAAGAFGRGDFRTARRLARQTLESEPTDAERAFAAQVLWRTDVDPVALWIAIGCLALFVFVVILAVVQS